MTETLSNIDAERGNLNNLHKPHSGRSHHMPSHYVQKALEILREEGPVKFSKISASFIMGKLDPQYHRRFKLYTWKNHLQNRIMYDAPPEPYKIIEISPNNIETAIVHKVGRQGTTNSSERPLQDIKKQGIARTNDGDWDRHPYRLDVENNFIIESLVQRFEKGIEWEETSHYQHHLEKYSHTNKHKERGFDDLQKYLQTRYERIDQLYDTIKDDGYIRGHNGSHLQPSKNQPVRDKLEILVVIDRNGQVCFLEGNHRFGIARVLDIEIPAQVVCRHKQWQELRDEIHNNNLPEDRKELRDHPDLQDILN